MSNSESPPNASNVDMDKETQNKIALVRLMAQGEIWTELGPAERQALQCVLDRMDSLANRESPPCSEREIEEAAANHESSHDLEALVIDGTIEEARAAVEFAFKCGAEWREKFKPRESPSIRLPTDREVKEEYWKRYPCEVVGPELTVACMRRAAFEDCYLWIKERLGLDQDTESDETGSHLQTGSETKKEPKTILFSGLNYGKQYRQAQAVVDFILKSGSTDFVFKIEGSDRIAELEKELAQMKGAGGV